MLCLLLGDAQPVIGDMNVASVNLGIDAVNVVYQGQVTTIATYSSPYVVNVMANGGDPSSIGIGQLYTANYDHIQFVVDTASSNITDASGNVYPIQFQDGSSDAEHGQCGQRHRDGSRLGQRHDDRWRPIHDRRRSSREHHG